MFNEEIEEVSKSAYKKVFLLKNNLMGYFFAAIIAGVYVSLGVTFAFSVGAMIHDFSAYKLILGICFGVALSLCAMAGAELFTGNNFVVAVGINRKTVTFADSVKLLVMCYLGNLVGSLLVVLLFFLGGFLKAGNIPEFFIETANSKINLTPVEIITRAIMCNILVSAATWCGYRCKSESGKLIMIFWCILAFITSSFEHSIANMSLLVIGLISPNSDISISGILYNIPLATIGNILGGAIFLAVPYLIIAKKGKNEQK
ncbi:formate/nitrite transporter family protein [uncultured Tyzzerella sp.]|uniref:formate/nitrite transporter family protein n=1 Tax=uncultured Tyzzerella sp. TaxID=2321398 RepID=UPI00294335F9|nr:formate/nitrite transporter family protein [uncultured Tyzzerella sp.]